MRVVLVGAPKDREQLRRTLPAVIDVVGESPTIAWAESSGLHADAWLVAPAAHPASTSAPVDEPPNEPLTRREMEVLEALTEGLSNKAIAARLGIGDQTVKFHVASICGKLGVQNRTGAVRVAIQRGLVTI